MKKYSVIALCALLVACKGEKTETLVEYNVGPPAPKKLIVEEVIDRSQEIIAERQEKEVNCLALNVYHESRSDNLAGQFAVADVVLNRVRDRRWPNTICDVIQQGPISTWWFTEHQREVPIKHRCQFSWYCDGKSDDPHDNQSWQQALTVSHQIYYNKLHRGITEGATHYHASYVNPSWNKHFQPIGRIGAHLFYRAE